MWYYEIKFKDGRYVRRENVSKRMASAMYESMSYEMFFFDVDQVSFGRM
jgi:hypothetical protein